MRTNAGLRKMLDDLGCRAPIRFVRLPHRAEGLCIPGVGIFIDKKYQTQAIPDPYLKAVVCHEVGHWRDPVVWLTAAAVGVGILDTSLWLCAPAGWSVSPLWVGGLIITSLGVAPWKERRADAYARRHMVDYDIHARPFKLTEPD